MWLGILARSFMFCNQQYYSLRTLLQPPSHAAELPPPLLCVADLFRSCQSKTGDSSMAVSTSTVNPIHQFSKTQIQRFDQAGQRLNQKQKKQDAVEDRENIQATISEDLADGQTAKLDASLKLLGEDDLKLLLPNDLEADEIHIIEATTSRLQDNKHDFQQYQMQLILLEQQNKKRLLDAKREKDGRSPSPFNEVAAARELKRRHQTDAVVKKQAEAGQTQRPSRDPKALQVKRKMPALGADKGTVPAPKRQKRGTEQPTQSSKVTKSDIVNGSGSSATQTGTLEVRYHCF